MNETEKTYHSELFTEDELNQLLSVIPGKTFEEVDAIRMFDTQIGRTIKNMDKGIFGKVINFSVLNMKPDTEQAPDIKIYYPKEDKYVHTEIKTTGLVKKKGVLSPKERVSVTAVSIGTIENETFDNSNFNHKIEHLLWVFYVYQFKGKGKERFSPYEQRKFKILCYGYQNMADTPEDYEIFHHDWLVVHDYLVDVKDKPDKETNWYPMFHENIKDRLVYIDISPRYPHAPRLAFKDTYVETIYNKLFKKKVYEKLNFTFSSIEELSDNLHKIAERYRNLTIQEIFSIAGISSEEKKTIKNHSEVAALAMLDKDVKKLNRIEPFCKAGIIIKTITLNKKGGYTEAGTKLFSMDVEEFSDTSIEYEDTNYYNYFSNKRYLVPIFQEQSDEEDNELHRFLGFKWVTFTSSLIYGDALSSWSDIREKITENKLEIIDNAPNFPKSAQHIIFVRGTSNKKMGKNWEINGLPMYHQDIWIKSKYFVEELKKTSYL